MVGRGDSGRFRQAADGAGQFDRHFSFAGSGGVGALARQPPTSTTDFSVVLLGGRLRTATFLLACRTRAGHRGQLAFAILFGRAPGLAPFLR